MLTMTAPTETSHSGVLGLDWAGMTHLPSDIPAADDGSRVDPKAETESQRRHRKKGPFPSKDPLSILYNPICLIF